MKGKTFKKRAVESSEGHRGTRNYENEELGENNGNKKRR